MATRRRQQFLIGTIAWQLGTILVLALLGSLSRGLRIVVSMIGLLVVTELAAPCAITPAWRRRLLWIIWAGRLGFGYIVIRRILEILPSGVI